MGDDGSAEIALAWAQRFPDNMTYLWQENRGVASARNAGAALPLPVHALAASMRIPGFQDLFQPVGGRVYAQTVALSSTAREAAQPRPA